MYVPFKGKQSNSSIWIESDTINPFSGYKNSIIDFLQDIFVAICPTNPHVLKSFSWLEFSPPKTLTIPPQIVFQEYCTHVPPSANECLQNQILQLKREQRTSLVVQKLKKGLTNNFIYFLFSG